MLLGEERRMRVMKTKKRRREGGRARGGSGSNGGHRGAKALFVPQIEGAGGRRLLHLQCYQFSLCDRSQCTIQSNVAGITEGEGSFGHGDEHADGI